MNYVAWPAAYDSQVMLIRNTPWARGFFHIAAERRQDPSATAEVWLRRPRTLRLSCLRVSRGTRCMEQLLCDVDRSFSSASCDTIASVCDRVDN